MQNFASWTQLWGRRSAVPAASPSAPARSATVSERSAKTEERLDGAAQRVRDDRPPETWTRTPPRRRAERNDREPSVSPRALRDLRLLLRAAVLLARPPGRRGDR